ncbi:MAG: hypothetical protein ACREU6_02535, partial [Steroidobacteraceae bacterium]
LEPAFGLQVSLGLVNTVVLCPGLTSHSELKEQPNGRPLSYPTCSNFLATLPAIPHRAPK